MTLRGSFKPQSSSLDRDPVWYSVFQFRAAVALALILHGNSVVILFSEFPNKLTSVSPEPVCIHSFIQELSSEC